MSDGVPIADSFPLLGLVSPSLRPLIERRLRVARIPKGRTVMGAGARSTDVYLIAEGDAQVVLYSPSGREVSVRNLSSGDLFGELAALDGAPRSAEVIASTDLKVVVMSRKDFLTCIQSSPEAALWLAVRLGAEVRRLTERTFELSAMNVQARLRCELLRMARQVGGDGPAFRIDPAPTHAELASRIGANREAVTREMRALVQQKVLAQHRRALQILDLEGLRPQTAQLPPDAADAI